MKKLISLILCISICCGFAFVSAAHEEGFFVKNATIVVGANASQTDRYAAEKLAYYLGRVTGGEYTVATDSTAKGGAEIVVGETARKQFDLSSYDNGGYIIKSEGDTVYICGAGTRGTIYGVYGFLEKYCGCRWYRYDSVSVPSNAQLVLPTDIDDSYEPFFEYTQTDTNSSRDPEFSVANGHSGLVYCALSPEQGGGVGYIGSFAHTLTTQFCKSANYFETNPEYFALHKGKRTPNQLCLTNPKTLEIVTAEVLAAIKANHDPSASVQILSLTQHDNQDYCECKSCKALDGENGSQSGTMITFVNAVAKAVEDAGYTNIAIDTFAYQYTRKAPTKVVPRDNVIVRLCSIECCFGHTLDDEKCNENAAFMADLEAWGKICNRIYIWDYVNNYRETICIFPNFNVLQRNVQIFYENNVKGVYEEGNYYISECDGEFGDLRTYLLQKLMQNPYIDLETEFDGYLAAVYGPGWRYIKEFIEIITAHAVTDGKHLTIYQEAKKTLYGMTNADIAHCDELWQAAMNKATTSQQFRNILQSRLSWRYWKCANAKAEFSRLQFPYLWIKAQDDLYNDLKAFGVIRVGEGDNRYFSECDILHLIREPFKWSVLFDEPYWDALNPYMLKLYAFLEKVYTFFNAET
ncbi:MAG: DUF4838 domain-containing protein [Clostridia bacterium]|nr:DUF4838 domain-containing protein [Clostridia bacterium]